MTHDPRTAPTRTDLPVIAPPSVEPTGTVPAAGLDRIQRDPEAGAEDFAPLIQGGQGRTADTLIHAAKALAALGALLAAAAVFILIAKAMA